MSISIESDVNLEYSAYLLGGIDDLCIPVHFSRRPTLVTPPHVLAVVDRASGRKIILDTGDRAVVDERLLQWSDAYRVTNYDPQWRGDPHFAAVKPLGPTFGVRSWGTRTAFDALVAVARVPTVLSMRQKAAQLWRMARHRVSVEELRPSQHDAGDIHFIGRAWSRHPETIAPRVAFLEACEAAGVVVHGGLVVDEGCTRVPSRFRLARPIAYRDYLRRMSSSMVAFNAPAVHGCLGWKLGEFLALGMPIISFPLGRELPMPLVHGTNVHFVDGTTSSMVEAIQMIARDRDYRRHLSIGARAYFDAVVHPRAMMQSVLHG